MSELDRELMTEELSPCIAPLVTGLLWCTEQLGETKRSSLDDDMDVVDRMTFCETSIAVECHRLLHSTDTHGTLDCGISTTSLVADLMAAAD